MALSTTTLSAGITASQLVLPLTSTVGILVNQPMQIDGEYMIVAGPITATTVKVRFRGYEGSLAAPHDANATVITGTSGADFPAVPTGAAQRPQYVDDVVTIGADRTVVVPLKNTIYLLAKPTALALTLTSGTPAQLGIKMTFVNQNAVAHVMTYPPGLLGGTNTVMTFIAKAGASIGLQVGTGGILGSIGGDDNVTLSA